MKSVIHIELDSETKTSKITLDGKEYIVNGQSAGTCQVSSGPLAEGRYSDMLIYELFGQVNRAAFAIEHLDSIGKGTHDLLPEEDAHEIWMILN